MRQLPLLILVASLGSLAGCASQVGAAPDRDCTQGSQCPSGICLPDGFCLPPGAVDAGLFGDGGTSSDGGVVPGSDGGSTGTDGGVVGSDGGSSDLDGGTIESDGGTIESDGGTIDDDGGTIDTDGGQSTQCHDQGLQRPCGSAVGTCQQGTQTCDGEFWGKCEGFVGPAPEQCDGRDHDCDGVPNNALAGCECTNSEERSCYNGPAGTEGVGTCRAGTQVCTDGRWGDCQGAVEPVPGDCTGPSCTGGTNPNCPCYLGQTQSCFTGPGLVNVGICRAGSQTCVATTGTGADWGPCEGQRTAEPEQCDGQDHDCNNVPNDPPTGCDCQTGQSRPCYGGPAGTEGVGTCAAGTQQCTSGRWGSCEGSVEPIPGLCTQLSCAGTPNPGCDCVVGTTRSCYSGDPTQVGVGTCRAGTQRCISTSATTSAWDSCLNEQLPRPEQCDGQDHDCNGTPNDRPTGCDCTNDQTRSCYNGPAGTQGVGTCRAGTETCVDGRWGSCQGAVEPEPGNCTQLSCAGTLNPGCLCLVGATQACYTGIPATRGVGTCRDGSQSCVATANGSTWGTCNNEVLPGAEQCDGQDHDCNNVPDDPPTGCICTLNDTQLCYSGPPGTQGVGTCAAGSQTCVLNGGQNNWGPCQGEVKPVPDDCDNPSCTGPNNPNPGCDCINGRTQSCYTGPSGTAGVGTCVAGTQTCTGGTWAACGGQTLPASQDLCVPANATYSAYRTSDLNCNNQLDRHTPTALPTASAPGATPLSVAGYAHAIEVKPLRTVAFSGQASDADGAGSFGYAWRIIAAPAGNTAGLSGAPGAGPTDISTQQNPTLFAQLVGDYSVGLRVTDGTGCQSGEAKVLVRVKPQTTLLVQVTWAASVDIDIQLAQGDTAAFFATDACGWYNTSTSWGATLDIDDLAGCNSENIALASPPANGASFTVYVHYYCNWRGHRFSYDDGFSVDTQAVCYESGTQRSANTTATMKLFVDGEERSSQSRALPQPNYANVNSWTWWKPMTLRYQDGIWQVTQVNQIGTTDQGCSSTAGTTSCVCGGSANNANCSDPFCGPTGAGCRTQYNYTGTPPLCEPL